MVAIIGAAFSRGKKFETEAISHCRPKRPGVEVEVERRRRQGVDPVTCMLEIERKEPSLISAGSAVGEERVLMGVYFAGKRMLSGIGRE